MTADVAVALVLAGGLAVSGCARIIDTATPHPAPRVGPILANQVGDLLSKQAQDDKDGNRFVSVVPDSCAGAAREKDAPFIVDHHPEATDGGHWVAAEGRPVYVEEIVAVYAADFDARSAITGARSALEACRTPFTVTDMKGREYHFSMGVADQGSPHSVIWSFHAADWACDNAFVAAHNAAIEITTCGSVGGYNVTALARDALKLIESLANTKA
ncbi:sensor domain-containing protein [Mycolicibacterium fluoranthenivorans]|uniref:sensor domain-containing protein n=1 Tax=Mycolicibacterium fluoranthenivorans TaxID=258505 RepID=UPI001F1D9250|nr:sensor domain-containing protein [Mycolicibacterium fluoranthenivorans]